jgi:hydrogenase 3 maturation protease
MQNLKRKIKSRIKHAERIVVLGIGSELRGDDSAGIITCRYLKQAVSARKIQPGLSKRLKIFLCASVPENFTGQIKRFKPTHIIVIDTADLSKKPGALEFIDPEKITGETFSTHRLPPQIFIRYLLEHFQFQLLTIGIQPKNLGLCAQISPEVDKASKLLAFMLEEIILDCFGLKLRKKPYEFV